MAQHQDLVFLALIGARQQRQSAAQPHEDQVIASSRQIINGTQLGNKRLVDDLTSEGSEPADWGKYSTETFKSPSGPFQVHFYFNSVTEETFYGSDCKAVFVGGSP